jgi:hypothetical protein
MASRNRVSAAIILSLLCLTILVPRVQVGRVAVGFDDFLAAILLLAGTAVLCIKPNIFFCKSNKLFLLLLWVVLILSGIFFGIFNSITYLDRLFFPTEMWQYVKRMSFFYCAMYFAYTGVIPAKKFKRLLMCVLFIALLLGLMQVIPGSIGRLLAKIYARSDLQLIHLTERSLAVCRTIGVAGFSTAWGGFAMFAAALALASLLFVKRTKIWSLVLLLMALSNIMLSGSKVAVAAGLVVFLCFLLSGFLLQRNKVFFLLNCLFFIGLTIASSYKYLILRYNFLVFRFEAMIQRGEGGARFGQAKMVIALLDGLGPWLFGISNVVQRKLAVSHGTEVEPVYLLVNYGILGVALRYGLILLIFIYSYRLFRKSGDSDDRSLALAALMSILGYMVFSLGYFFYQELYVGLLPWLLFGWVVGTYFRRKNMVRWSPKFGQCPPPGPGNLPATI